MGFKVGSGSEHNSEHNRNAHFDRSLKDSTARMDPNLDPTMMGPNLDPNVNSNVDPAFDPTLDPSVGPNSGPNSGPNYGPNSGPDSINQIDFGKVVFGAHMLRCVRILNQKGFPLHLQFSLPAEITAYYIPANTKPAVIALCSLERSAFGEIPREWRARSRNGSTI